MTLQLLNQHVDRFNQAVRTGDWESMMAHFTDDAELRFEGVPAGPFEGRDEIAQAYREQPPDDEVRILESGRVGDETIADYAWAADPERRAGELRLTERDGRIARLVVTFEEEDEDSEP
jgi:steroid Delta-isomerase